MGDALLLADGELEELVKAGTKVEVRRRFDQRWARGFEVVEDSDEGIRVRRLSDGAELPVYFTRDEIRKERKQGLWWY
jgi:hypothetical protein